MDIKHSELKLETDQGSLPAKGETWAFPKPGNLFPFNIISISHLALEALSIMFII